MSQSAKEAKEAYERALSIGKTIADDLDDDYGEVEDPDDRITLQIRNYEVECYPPTTDGEGFTTTSSVVHVYVKQNKLELYLFNNFSSSLPNVLVPGRQIQALIEYTPFDELLPLIEADRTIWSTMLTSWGELEFDAMQQYRHANASLLGILLSDRMLNFYEHDAVEEGAPECTKLLEFLFSNFPQEMFVQMRQPCSCDFWASGNASYHLERFRFSKEGRPIEIVLKLVQANPYLNLAHFDAIIGVISVPAFPNDLRQTIIESFVREADTSFNDYKYCEDMVSLYCEEWWSKVIKPTDMKLAYLKTLMRCRRVAAADARHKKIK